MESQIHAMAAKAAWSLELRAQLIDNSDLRVRPWAELRVFALLSIWAPELPNQAGKSVDICTTGTVERPERP